MLAQVLAESRELTQLHYNATSQFPFVHEKELPFDDWFMVEFHENLIVGSDVLKELELVFLAHFDSIDISCRFFSAFENFWLGSFS